MIVLLGTALPALGQSSPPSDSKLQLAFADGVQAVRGGNGSEAASLLERVFTDTPSYFDTEEGSAAYWLGRAYEENERLSRAISTWRVVAGRNDTSPKWRSRVNVRKSEVLPVLV